jgi:hypothetical protein
MKTKKIEDELSGLPSSTLGFGLAVMCGGVVSGPEVWNPAAFRLLDCWSVGGVCAPLFQAAAADGPKTSDSVWLFVLPSRLMLASVFDVRGRLRIRSSSSAYPYALMGCAACSGVTGDVHHFAEQRIQGDNGDKIDGS